MATRKLVIGDDIGIVVYLKTRNPLTNTTTAANVTGGTVQVALLHNGTSKLSATCADAATFTNKSGITYTADYSTGLIVATFTSAQTAVLDAHIRLDLEVTVDDGGVTTWPIGTFDSYVTTQDYIDS